MTHRSRTPKPFLCCLFASLFLSAADAAAQQEGMNCVQTPTTHIRFAKGDQNTADRLGVSRKVAAGASIDVDVCAADLTVRGGKDDLLHVDVAIDKPTAKGTAGDYLQALDITPQVNVRLELPRPLRAKVVIVVPASTPKLHVNLVRGQLSFETDKIGGERSINLVSGHVDKLANPDSYSTLHASVLMGRYHDYPRRQNAHGLVSKSLSGKGNGSIDINVVRGSVDLKAWD